MMAGIGIDNRLTGLLIDTPKRPGLTDRPDFAVAGSGGADLPAGAGHAKETARSLRAARDFESVLLHKLLDEMQRTVPKSGLLDDEMGEQVQSIVSMHLSQEIASKGGIGLWQELHRQMEASFANGRAASGKYAAASEAGANLGSAGVESDL